MFEKIIDLFMFREGTPEDSLTDKPVITMGSIVWGVLLRSFVILLLTAFVIQKYSLQEYWWGALFIIWAFAAFPGYRQYQKFNERMDDFKESTLCGSCRNFEPSGQLCKIYDEHVSKNHIPCDGESWEPK